MSLGRSETQRTSDELHANFELSGLTRTEVEVDLGLAAQPVDEIFAVVHAKPEDVWMLRDYLEDAIVTRGETPHPYSSLTPTMRAAAARWFPLHKPVRHRDS